MKKRTRHRALPPAVADSRDFIAAKRRAETEVLPPKGTKIAFPGSGISVNLADKAKKIDIPV